MHSSKCNLALCIALACAAGAAHPQGALPAAADRYPPSAIVLDSPASKTTSERHRGAFAEGASLRTGARLMPLDPPPVKTLRLDTTHKIIEIAPGVKFSAWTFGDQVPGPTVRARVGDRIRFTM